MHMLIFKLTLVGCAEVSVSQMLLILIQVFIFFSFLYSRRFSIILLLISTSGFILHLIMAFPVPMYSSVDIPPLYISI